MQVYALPAEVPAPKIDYANFDLKAEMRAQKEHSAKLKEHLVSVGYAGPHTGKVLSIPHADSAAQYMIADAPKGFCLIHLPYMDGWDSPWARKLTKKEAIAMADQKAKLKSMFGDDE